MTLTNSQKQLYNQHLSTYKRRQNKPYTTRADFDTFVKDKPEDYQCLIRLDNFFTNHPAVNRKLFFDAPYKIYEDKDFFNLGYYNSQAAIKSYTLYLKQLSEQSPDSASQLEFITDSLKFIHQFCMDKKIYLRQYFEHSEGQNLSWVANFANHNTSIYALIGFTYFGTPIKDLMMSLPFDEIQMFFENELTNYTIYKTNLDNSKTAKKLIMEGIKIIDKRISKDLKST